jgi:phosphatidate cytidylyltransferase
VTRVLSALLLLPAVLAVVWFLPPWGTVALAAVAAVLACFELGTIAAALGAAIPRPLVAVFAAAISAAVGLGSAPADVVVLTALVVLGTVFVATREPGPSLLAAAASAVFAVVYIGLSLGSVAAIRTIAGREALLLLTVAIVVSDSAQYYTGRAFGRAPLAPRISPKKTREGAIGGVVFGTAVLVLGGRFLFPTAHPALLVAVSLAVIAAGIVGDLFESLLKRSAGVKDSSALIPGHGGILDRIDSWLFAGPVYYFFIRYLQP